MLRRAHEGDAEPIAALHIASWQHTYRNELAEEYLRALDVASWGLTWRRRLAEGATVLLAEEDNALVGFVACGPVAGRPNRPRAWEIFNLHVAAAWHAKGWGNRLFEAAIAFGRESGAEELVLWVVRTNVAARGFYERKGMMWDGGEQEHRVGDGQKLAEVCYRMPLQARG